tara:strand:+ start:37958 stop:38194 length:237 start_codon:yes stop_codon:yes gene_type:complete
MYQLSSEQLKLISAGSQCEVVTHVYSTNPTNYFIEFKTTSVGECDSMRESFENNVFHDMAQKWKELGYLFNIELHELS